MTKRELVIATINHEDTGRLPYCFDFTQGASDLLKAHYGCEDVAEAVGNCILGVPGPWWEFVNVPEDQLLPAVPSRLPDVRGVPAPWWEFVNVPEEQLRPGVPSRLPDVIGRGSFDTMRESVTTQRESTDAFLIFGFYASLFEKAWFVRGMENLLADMILNEEYCTALFDRIVESDLHMLEMVLAAEVDGVLLGCDWGSQQALMMGPEMWHKYIGPRHARMFRRIREAGKYAFLHSCGNIRAVLPEVADMGVQVLNPVQPECMDTGALKDELGDRLCFWGTIDEQHTLPFGSPDDVRREVKQRLATIGRGGGLILGPTHHVQLDTPLENFRALVETIKGTPYPAA